MEHWYLSAALQTAKVVQLTDLSDTDSKEKKNKVMFQCHLKKVDEEK
jgi:hypothetical protein